MSQQWLPGVFVLRLKKEEQTKKDRAQKAVKLFRHLNPW
jgi:hypothetical protein